MLLALALLAGRVALRAATAPAAAWLRLGARQLFLDVVALDDLRGAHIEVQRPHPAGDEPVLKVDRPWEHHLWFYNSVVQNGASEVALYYHVYVGTVKGEDKPGENYQDPFYAATGLARSTDGEYRATGCAVRRPCRASQRRCCFAGGRTFVKPALGVVVLNGTANADGSGCAGCNGSATNLVFPLQTGPSRIGTGSGYAPGTVFLDERPGVPRDERWKMVALWTGTDNNTLDLVETRALGSPDGIRWRCISDALYTHSDTQNVALWSPLAGGGQGAYVAFRRLEAKWVGTERSCSPCVVAQPGKGEAPKGFCGSAILDGGGSQGVLARVVAMCEGQSLTASDFTHCTPTNRSNIVLGPDNLDSPCIDFYTNNVVLYSGHYLMMPDVLDHFPSPPVWNVGDDGVMDVRLLHSRDGRHWSYVGGTPDAGTANATSAAGRQPWLQRSPSSAPINDRTDLPDKSSWAAGIISTVRGYVVKDDEIWLYVFGTPCRHQQHIQGTGEIRRYTLRRDGWAALVTDAASFWQKPATVATSPFRLPLNASSLHFNALADDGGSVVVELWLEQQGGWTRAGSAVPFAGDSVDHRLVWEGGAGVVEHAVQQRVPVQLRMTMRNAKLFSWWCEGDEPQQAQGLKSDDASFAGVAQARNSTLSEIFIHGEAGCVCIGIPALINTRNSTIFAFAECRSSAGDGCSPSARSGRGIRTPQQSAPCKGTCIIVKRSSNSGRDWGAPGFATGSCGGNPMPVWDTKRKQIVVNFADGTVKDPPFIQQAARIMSTVATGDGPRVASRGAWSTPRVVTTTWPAAPGPNGGLQLRSPGSPFDGRLLFSGWSNNTGRACDVVVWYSDDGANFKRSASRIAGACETGLAQLPIGSVILLGNDGGTGAGTGFPGQSGPCPGNTLQHYLSSDGGTSFSAVHCDASLVNAWSQASVLVVGQSLVVANPEGRDPSHAAATHRTKMVIHASESGGRSFRRVPVVFDEGAAEGRRPWAGYSSLVRLNETTDWWAGLGWESGAPGCEGSRCRVLFSTFDVRTKTDDASAGGLPSTPVFTMNTEGYLCYRTTSLLRVGNGSAAAPHRLLAFTEARTWTGDGCHPYGGPPEPPAPEPPHGAGFGWCVGVDLGMKSSRDGGQTWSPLKVVADPRAVLP
jgi:hypothetical protein